MLISNPDLDNSLQKLNSQVILECVELTVKTKSEKYIKSTSKLKQIHTGRYAQMNTDIHIHERMP